jgi:hypothetical protein
LPRWPLPATVGVSVTTNLFIDEVPTVALIVGGGVMTRAGTLAPSPDGRLEVGLRSSKCLAGFAAVLSFTSKVGYPVGEYCEVVEDGQGDYDQGQGDN